jgi:hypothetical protein
MVEDTGGIRMRLWADSEKKTPLDQISFGKVPVGKEKVLTIYIENDSKAVLTNLIYEFPHLPPTEVLKVTGPVTLQPGEVAPLTLVWRPSPVFKQALTVDLLIKGEEVYLAEEKIPVEKKEKT